jgi:hypothetical protein
MDMAEDYLFKVNIYQIFNSAKTYLDKSVWGSIMFSTMVLFLFHCDSLGFAAARMDVRAFSWQMIPALAMLNVCCSITCKMQINILLVL